MYFWIQVWVILGLLLWLGTLLLNPPETLAKNQLLVGSMITLLWPFIVIGLVYQAVMTRWHKR